LFDRSSIISIGDTGVSRKDKTSSHDVLALVKAPPGIGGPKVEGLMCGVCKKGRVGLSFVSPAKLSRADVKTPGFDLLNACLAVGKYSSLVHPTAAARQKTLAEKSQAQQAHATTVEATKPP
jgi:hypothetical protein